MTAFFKHTAGADGWSEWVNPKAKGYKFSCCDCGLVHDMDFKVVRFKRRPSNAYTAIRSQTLAPMFRARRNNRSTAMIRRHQTKTLRPAEQMDSHEDETPK